MKWNDIIDSHHGMVQIPDQYCSFEFIEELYEQIKPMLAVRKAMKISEGSDDGVQKTDREICLGCEFWVEEAHEYVCGLERSGYFSTYPGVIHNYKYGECEAKKERGE